jgi:hypothetical protein
MRRTGIFIFVATASVLLVATMIASCSDNPTSPSQSLTAANSSQTSMNMKPASVTVGGPPGYEEAYVGGTTVWINAIEVKQNPTGKAQADFYEVVYPFDPATGEELTSYWPSAPQCDPCDHQMNGITPDDFHDHVLDSRPSNPTGREYNALWHVWVIMPNYTSDAGHNADVNAALQSILPVKSEDALNTMLTTDVDGMPLATKIDTQFYFLCAVVGAPAATHTH